MSRRSTRAERSEAGVWGARSLGILLSAATSTGCWYTVADLARGDASIDGADAATDARTDTGKRRDGGSSDTGPGSDTSSLLALGSVCATGPACQSGICGTSLLLTSNVLTPGGASVCTKACCTSADCNDPVANGFVCYPSAGGNYCVDPAWIGLSPVTGAAVSGSPCSVGAACRSGVCSGSICRDTCCLDSDCVNGTVCQYSMLDGTPSFNCGPSGGAGTQGTDCTCGQPCQSNACVGATAGDYCLGPCCKDSDCADPAAYGTTSCIWSSLYSSDGGVLMLRGCTAPVNSGGAATGSACTSNTDCSSNLCYENKTCTAACCSSADCLGGWTCSYASFTFSPSTLDLQVCVPP